MTTSREAILARIRSSLQHSRPTLEREAASAPHTPPAFVHPPQDDLAAQFATELAKLEGKPHRCADDEEALEAIRGILVAHQATAMLGWDLDQIGLPGLEVLLQQQNQQFGQQPQLARHAGEGRAAWLQRLEPAQVGISGADVGIAESGTLLLRSGAGRGRLASLLAPVHIAVLRQSQLVHGLGEALARLHRAYGADPFDTAASLIMITGPSRTADIELTLTLGVHGPREIHVVLIG